MKKEIPLRIMTNKAGEFAFEDTSRQFFIIRDSGDEFDKRYLSPKNVLYGLEWSRLFHPFETN